jgi:hypothetical protein
MARAAACQGDVDSAVDFLHRLTPWMERAPAWGVGMPILACHAAETLWRLQRIDEVQPVEHCLRTKVIGPDFRSPMVDGRLALARVRALQGDHDEALQWLGAARTVLTEQSARPLLAIATLDEATILAARGAPGDAERAAQLTGEARRDFEVIGMPGWTERT